MKIAAKSEKSLGGKQWAWVSGYGGFVPEWNQNEPALR